MITEDLEGIVSAIWDCENCDWKNDGYKELDNGEKKAYAHAELGHIVRGEIVTIRKIVGVKGE